MARLGNPVFAYELRSRLRVRKLVPAIILRCVCLGLIFLLALLARLGRGVLAFVLAESFLILLFTPGAVCYTFSSNTRQGRFRELALTRLSSPAILLGKLATADLYTCIIVVFSAIIMCITAVFRDDLHVWRLVCTNAALLILMFSSAVIGLFFSMIFRRNGFAGYMLAYMLVFLLIGSVIIPGPMMERIQSSGLKAAITKVALYANPLVMTSRSLGRIDLMRTRYIYNLAGAIVDRGFTYPDWYFAGAVYLAISCLFVIPVFIRFNIIYRT